MFDMFTEKGYKVETDGVMVMLYEPSGREAGVYHPLQGKVISGIRSPSKIVEIMEELDHGCRIVFGDCHTA